MFDGPLIPVTFSAWKNRCAMRRCSTAIDLSSGERRVYLTYELAASSARAVA